MSLQKFTGGWATRTNANLTKSDLQEGRVYSLPYLSKDGVTLVNECVYAVIDGEIVIHRSANWEDVPTSDLRKESFFLEKDKTLSQVPSDIPLFVDLEKTVG